MIDLHFSMCVLLMFIFCDVVICKVFVSHTINKIPSKSLLFNRCMCFLESYGYCERLRGRERARGRERKRERGKEAAVIPQSVQAANMLRTVLLSSLLLPLFLPFGTPAYHEIYKRDTKGPEWDYEKEGTGPENWASLGYKECDGDRQSPINIVHNKADLNENLGMFEFSDNYDDPLVGATIMNNGHTIAIKPANTDPERWIKKGGLDDEYHFESLHFHWGSTSKQGSEHQIDGKKYPLEMHMVHRNKNYKTVTEAQEKEDGLAVLSVFYELDDDDNSALEPIIDQLDDVRKESTTAELADSFNLESLMPDDLMPYYRYEGSLTTPPCSEAVQWTVFKNTVTVSEKQLNLFRNVKEEEVGEPEENLVDNFRPVQDLNKRTVEISPDEDTNSAISLATPTMLLLFSIFAALLMMKNN